VSAQVHQLQRLANTLQQEEEDVDAAIDNDGLILTEVLAVGFFIFVNTHTHTHCCCL
jgi:hypothetical protein